MTTNVENAGGAQSGDEFHSADEAEGSPKRLQQTAADTKMNEMVPGRRSRTSSTSSSENEDASQDDQQLEGEKAGQIDVHVHSDESADFKPKASDINDMEKMEDSENKDMEKMEDSENKNESDREVSKNDNSSDLIADAADEAPGSCPEENVDSELLRSKKAEPNDALDQQDQSEISAADSTVPTEVLSVEVEESESGSVFEKEDPRVSPRPPREDEDEHVVELEAIGDDDDDYEDVDDDYEEEQVEVHETTSDNEQQSENEAPDDDEDKGNPAYIPKIGRFYMHDRRTTDENTDQTSDRIGRADAVEKWTHDRYDERYQRPKDAKLLINRYGYDIRSEDYVEGQSFESPSDGRQRNVSNRREQEAPRRRYGGGRRGSARAGRQGPSSPKLASYDGDRHTSFDSNDFPPLQSVSSQSARNRRPPVRQRGGRGLENNSFRDHTDSGQQAGGDTEQGNYQQRRVFHKSRGFNERRGGGARGMGRGARRSDRREQNDRRYSSNSDEQYELGVRDQYQSDDWRPSPPNSPNQQMERPERQKNGSGSGWGSSKRYSAQRQHQQMNQETDSRREVQELQQSPPDLNDRRQYQQQQQMYRNPPPPARPPPSYPQKSSYFDDTNYRREDDTVMSSRGPAIGGQTQQFARPPPVAYQAQQQEVYHFVSGPPPPPRQPTGPVYFDPNQQQRLRLPRPQARPQKRIPIVAPPDSAGR